MVNASSEEGYLAVNGMSYHARDSHNANSAIVVTVTPEDFESDHPLAGIAFQRKLEEAAYQAAGGRKRKNSGTEIRGFLPECDRKRKGKDRSRSLVSGT